MYQKKHPPLSIELDGFRHLSSVLRLNEQIFGEDRLINRMDHELLILLTAHFGDRLAGFKIGYALGPKIFYSAKGATSPLYRRRGVARQLLEAMLNLAEEKGFDEFHYDTFPGIYPGMTILGLRHGFQIQKISWNTRYKEFQLRMVRSIEGSR